jgi:hypothetical protein
MTLDGEMTNTKVVRLEKLWNFVDLDEYIHSEYIIWYALL